MASTMRPTTPTTSYAPMVQAQGVYMMPVQGRPRNIRPVPGIKCLSIATIVLAGVLVLLGITAAVIQARHSYLGNPIWTGLFFLLTTGILGLFVYKRQNSLCMNISFLVMTIVSSVTTFQLFVFEFEAATNEYSWRCDPDPGDHYNYNDDLCTPTGVRATADVIILLCALAALVLCIISFCLTLYGTFTCCYTCCYSCCTNSSTTTYSSTTPYLMTPMNGQNMQVMPPVQMTPQGTSGIHQAGSQPVLVSVPQPFTPNAPPAYMIATNASTATAPQATENPQPVSGSGNPTPPSGNIQIEQNNTPAGQIAAQQDSNWQKF